MKTIILVRHARVAINDRRKITAKQMQRWIEEYNVAYVSQRRPDEQIITYLSHVDMLLGSTLMRTTESLKLIGLEATEENSLFDEIELPKMNNEFIKLYPKKWLKLFRMMMILPISNGFKILKDSNKRSKMAALYLDRLAQQNGNVGLMGHGGMNWLLGKQLKKLGWKCIEDADSSKNWGYAIYRLEEENESTS
ncbi:MAG: hypothetical protein L3J43_08245 [Sulfurovum sp.]|nr:hypothetical protein [Sulfurovum sp.]